MRKASNRTLRLRDIVQQVFFKKTPDAEMTTDEVRKAIKLPPGQSSVQRVHSALNYLERQGKVFHQIVGGIAVWNRAATRPQHRGEPKPKAAAETKGMSVSESRRDWHKLVKLTIPTCDGPVTMSIAAAEQVLEVLQGLAEGNEGE